MTIGQLRNAVYDMLIANYDKKGKFYAEDCDSVWSATMKKSKPELIATVKRWNAINNISEAAMRRNCQFDGMGALAEKKGK